MNALVRVDLLLSWRRGVVAAAVGAAAAYIVLLRIVGVDLAETLLPYLVFSDPAALGFFFVGGVTLADRAEGIGAALSVTPVSASEVLQTRIGVLTGIGALSGLVVAAGSGVAVDWLVFTPTVVLTAVVYTCFGYAVAMRSRSVNEYFARATAWAIPLFAPLALFLISPESPLMALWPTTASLSLLRASVEGGDGLVIGFSLVGLAVAAAITMRWAQRELEAARREGRA